MFVKMGLGKGKRVTGIKCKNNASCTDTHDQKRVFKNCEGSRLSLVCLELTKLKTVHTVAPPVNEKGHA